MEVPDAGKNLFEGAFYLCGGHSTFADGCIEVTSRAEFHHFTPSAILVLHEIDGFDNVGMPKGRRNTEFGRELLDIITFRFLSTPWSELL
jgi:hypothetical protein